MKDDKDRNATKVLLLLIGIGNIQCISTMETFKSKVME